MYCIAFSFLEVIWTTLILEHTWTLINLPSHSVRFSLVHTTGLFIPHVWDHVSSFYYLLGLVLDRGGLYLCGIYTNDFRHFVVFLFSLARSVHRSLQFMCVVPQLSD